MLWPHRQLREKHLCYGADSDFSGDDLGDVQPGTHSFSWSGAKLTSGAGGRRFKSSRPDHPYRALWPLRSGWLWCFRSRSGPRVGLLLPFLPSFERDTLQTGSGPREGLRGRSGTLWPEGWRLTPATFSLISTGRFSKCRNKAIMSSDLVDC